MRLAVSNIAWLPDEAMDAYAIMANAGCGGLEIAPGLAFSGESDPFAPSNEAIARIRRDIGQFGLELVSMQSLLFGGIRPVKAAV